MASQHQYAEIEASLNAIVPLGSVFEIRCLGGGGNRKRIDAGYFDSPAAAATALAGLETPYQGIYMTPNPVAPELFARSANRISPWASLTTMDPDVKRRNWLLVDIDPRRPSGISSTDAERDAALKKAEDIAFVLAFQYGFAQPMFNSSGNGAHLMWRIDWPNTEEVRDACATFLKGLAARFDDEVVGVDTSVFNAARIWRVPGTWARKGDSVPQRPHRKSAIIRRADARQVPFDRLHAFVLANPVAGAVRPAGAAGATVNGAEYPADERKYRVLNDTAMRRIPEWVSVFFPDARPYKEGFRVPSDSLNRSLEEELTIHPWPLGIKDFGVSDQGDSREGRRTPVSLLAEHFFAGDKDQAARKLADTLKTPVTEFNALPPPPAQVQLPGYEPIRAKFDFGSIRTVGDLRKRQFKEPKYIIPGVLPTGNMLLAARPKMRKTWLALQLAKAVATGGKFLEWQCNQGDVLGLFLEDNDRRLAHRMQTLETFEMQPADLSNFHYWTGGVAEMNGKLVVTNPEEQARTHATFPRGEAGVDALQQYHDEHPNTVLYIIDTLAHFKESTNERDIYARDYQAMMPLTRFAARNNVLVLPVTHEKKGLAGNDSADFLEDVTGSAGLTGGSDGVISIKGRRGVQDENESRKLYISGRDVPHDYEVDMSFDAQRGGWLPAARTDVKVALRALFDRHPYINQQELAALLPNVPKARLTKCLLEMKFEGELTQSKFGYTRART